MPPRRLASRDVDVLVVSLATAGGLVLGDQLEVVVTRGGAHRDLSRPWWVCHGCGQPLAWHASIPLVGIRSRRRRCSACTAPAEHRVRPAVLAVLCALAMGAFAARIGPHPELAAYLVLAPALVALGAVDLERLILPNRILYPAATAVAGLLTLSAGIEGTWGPLLGAVFGALVSFAAFFAIHLASPRGMGFGDVRLASLVGLVTGWFGWGQVFVAFLAAFLLGAVVGLIVMAVSGEGRKTRVPFGPFLALGAVVSIVAGHPAFVALVHHRL